MGIFVCCARPVDVGDVAETRSKVLCEDHPSAKAVEGASVTRSRVEKVRPVRVQITVIPILSREST